MADDDNELEINDICEKVEDPRCKKFINYLAKKCKLKLNSCDDICENKYISTYFTDDREILIIINARSYDEALLKLILHFYKIKKIYIFEETFHEFMIGRREMEIETIYQIVLSRYFESRIKICDEEI